MGNVGLIHRMAEREKRQSRGAKVEGKTLQLFINILSKKAKCLEERTAKLIRPTFPRGQKQGVLKFDGWGTLHLSL